MSYKRELLRQRKLEKQGKEYVAPIEPKKPVIDEPIIIEKPVIREKVIVKEVEVRVPNEVSIDDIGAVQRQHFDELVEAFHEFKREAENKFMGQSKILDRKIATVEESMKNLVQGDIDTSSQENFIRSTRDKLLKETDWYIYRHLEENQFGVRPTLTPLEYTLLLRYRNLLRKITKQVGFPKKVEWPDNPL